MFHPNKTYWRSWFSIVALLWSIVIPLLLFVLYEKADSVRIAQVQRLSYASHLAKDFVNEELTQAIEHTKIIAKNLAIQADFNQATLDKPNEVCLTLMGLAWQTIANESTQFDQIRWIANNGTELLRINYASAGAYRVPANELQAKADRYYVTAGLALPPDSVYLSPLDLNIEQQAIEVPYKPTIRIVSPVFDALGHRQGMIVINYLATEMLQHLQRVHRVNGMEFWLLNQEGYWLTHSDESQAWGFMLGQPDHRVEVRYPQLAHALKQAQSETVIDDRYYVHRLQPIHNNRIMSSDGLSEGGSLSAQGFTHAQDYYWWLVSFTPQETYRTLVLSELRDTVIVAFMLLLLSWYAGHIFAKARQIERQQTTQLRLAASVFTHANEGIMITDVNSVILDVNEEACRITGYAREELLGQKPKLLSSGRYDHAFYEAMQADLRRKGHWYGEIWNRRKTGELFAEFLSISAVYDNDGEIHHFVALFTDITVEKQYQHQLERIAHYDPLTNLPNRLLLADRLQQAMALSLRTETEMAVIFLDLDGFKGINDDCGHEKGDQILIDVAHALNDNTRVEDTISRFGGDEFIIVMPNFTDRTALSLVMHNIMTAIERKVVCNGHENGLSASLGITFYPQADPVDADQLIRQADQAMYLAKQSGKNGFHVFDVRQDKEARSNHCLIQEIEKALQRQEFVLHYQPKVCMATGEVLGFEALIRWQHPERGLVYPGAFLEFIELTSTSIQLASWVIQQALRDRLTWENSALALPVSVNLGALELQQVDFIEWITQQIAYVEGAKARWLAVEVLETHALSDLDHVTSVLRQLQNMGIEVNLDDFGTGYSSLSYLKHLPLDYIKVDQSFVRQMFQDAQATAMIEGVMSLIKALNHTSIAEGVETEAHGIELLRMGCTIGQGYFIAHPMPAPALSDWMVNWQAPASWLDQVKSSNRC